MKQIKALIVKEWNTNWTTFLIPLWFTLGVYVMGLIGLIINAAKGNLLQTAITTHGYPTGVENFALFSASSGSLIGLSFVATLSAIGLADTLLNGGFKRKCEILHLSQPVSITKILGVKYGFMLIGTLVLLGIITLINSIGISLFIGYYTGARLYFGLTAWAQLFIQIIFCLAFVSSLYWFFAGLFKRKSFFMGTLAILTIQAAISILNYTANMEIPSLVSYILRLSSVQPEANFATMITGVSDLNKYIDGRWSNLFNTNTLMQIIYSVIFCISGAWLYRRRELS